MPILEQIRLVQDSSAN